MNDWLDKSVSIVTTDKDKVFTGNLLHADATGVIVSITNKSESKIEKFRGLQEETEIQVYLPLFRIAYICQGNFVGIS